MSLNNLVKAAIYLDLEHKCYITNSNYVNYFFCYYVASIIHLSLFIIQA